MYLNLIVNQMMGDTCLACFSNTRSLSIAPCTSVYQEEGRQHASRSQQRNISNLCKLLRLRDELVSIFGVVLLRL